MESTQAQAERDFENAQRIGRAVDQVIAAVAATTPEKRRKGLRLESWHDTRGRVDDIPGLAVCFSTSIGLKTAVMEPPPGAGISHILILPNLLMRRLNERFVWTQTLIHHEIAHILCGHDISTGVHFRDKEAYFNDAREVEAYFHQTLAGMAIEVGWEGGIAGAGWHNTEPSLLCGENLADFCSRFRKEAHPAFLKALTDENAGWLNYRLAGFRRLALFRGLDGRPSGLDEAASTHQIPGP